MPENTEIYRQHLSREATDWLILLQDDPDDAERREEFQAWVNQSPAHASAWAETLRASAALDKAAPLHAAQWQPLLEAVRTPSRPPVSRRGRTRRPDRPNRRQAAGLAGLALAASLLAVLAGPSLWIGLRADYTTDTAEIRSFRLADDSTVTLAPESAIAVRFTDAGRHVQLLSGEALFQVTKNPARPFRVEARTVDITVLGTTFDVRHTETGADVAVAEGVVRVEHDSATTPVTETLAAGQSVRVRWSGESQRRDQPVGMVAAWRQDRLIARDDPLGAVVEQLRRYFPGRIIVTDDTLARETVTGVYDPTDPMEALRGIARAQKAVVRQITPWLVFVSPS